MAGGVNVRHLAKGEIEPLKIDVVDVFRWETVPFGRQLPFGAMWYNLPPNSASPQDCHSETELSIVIHGTASVEASGQINDVPTGEAFLLAPGEAHIIHNRSADQPLTVFSAYWMPAADSAVPAPARETAADIAQPTS